MVDYELDSERKLSKLQYAFAGGAAGAFTRAVLQPLDVLKIRFQLQTEPIRVGSKYSSLLQAVTTIVTEEGVRTLWSGHVPAQLLSIAYGLLQFSVFEHLTETAYQFNPDSYNSHKSSIVFLSGAVAASTATAVSFPFDTARTRLIAEFKNKKVYINFRHVLVSIVKKEGPGALYKGLLPSLVQIAPHTGIQFLVYKMFTDSILNKYDIFQRNNSKDYKAKVTFIGNLLAGSIAGFASKVAVYPLDLVKKRLQIQGFQEHRNFFGKQIYCNGIIQCIVLTIKFEGLLGLYKGLGTSILKACLVSALNFATYDEIKNFFLRNIV